MQEPINIDIAKYEAIQYYNSGNYFNDIYKRALEAEQLILSTTTNPSKDCVIFDLDETSISEYDFMLETNFAWTNDTEEQALAITNFPKIPEIHDLFGFCVSRKYYVVILTSRRQRYYYNTKDLINNAGYGAYSQLILRPDEDTGTIQNFKKLQREKLISQGYKILCNIGDQESDLKDDPKEIELPKIAIKIPNPFYLITCNV